MRKNLPFDPQKVYCLRRQGVVAGGSHSLQITPEGVVECYEEVIHVKRFEDGMKDRGAHMYFVGKREGIATVTLKYFYPTCPPEEEVFNLKVDQDLKVTVKE